ncbi:hypothetical protein IT415_02175 [bacterium]|nr:hypothetical protein [bacterium]
MKHLPLPYPPAPVFAIVGPSGSGKSTTIQNLLLLKLYLAYGQSLTSRSERPTDIQGKYIYDQTLSQICDAVASGEVLEWASFAGKAYATCKPDPAKPTIIDLEIQGAAQLMAFHPEYPITFIGILPWPDFPGTDRMSSSTRVDLFERNAALRSMRFREILQSRLEHRGDLTSAEIEARIAAGMLEIATISNLWPNLPNAHIVRSVQGRQEDTVAAIAKIIDAEHARWLEACQAIVSSPQAKRPKKKSKRPATLKLAPHT